MGFFGAMGKALKAPLKPINKAVGAIPGMRGIQSATPGMNAVSNATGVGVQPNQGQGIGPSNPALNKFSMMGQKMQQQPQMGATFPTPTPLSSPPPPLDTGYQAPNQLSDQPSPADMERIGQVGADMGARPDVMPPSGVSAPLAQGGQGLGPSPRMMPRRPMMNPRMRQPMM